MIRSRLRGAQAHAESPGRRSGKLKYGDAPVATQILLHPSPSFHTLLMTDDARYLVRQFETAWKLASYHLDGLTTKECLWRPAPEGLHVHQVPDGRWRADWPDREGYDIGPPSIAWLTWHIGFWWSTVLDRSFGEGTLSRESVMWPGAADGVRAWLGRVTGTVAKSARADQGRRPAINAANTLAFPGSSVRRRHRLGERRAHEERCGDRLRTVPLRRQRRQ